VLDFKKIYETFEGRIPCNGCFICCEKAGDVVLFPGESKTLVENIPSAKNIIYAKFIDGQKVELVKLPCPFLKNEMCSIEKNRPLDCRFFPFDYCIFNEEIVVITSNSCPATGGISETETKRIKNGILNIMHKVSKKWLKVSRLFGPCGNCNKKQECKRTHVDGYNIKDW